MPISNTIGRHFEARPKIAAQKQGLHLHRICIRSSSSNAPRVLGESVNGPMPRGTRLKTLTNRRAMPTGPSFRGSVVASDVSRSGILFADSLTVAVNK